MRPAQYSLIRYIPDPGRNEALNLGILAWDGAQYRLRIEPEAVARVIRENRHLASDALSYLEVALRQRVQDFLSAKGASLSEFIGSQPGFPVLFLEPRLTTLRDEEQETLDLAIERLLDRIVRPHRRGGGGTVSPFQATERRLAPLIRQHLVHTRYPFSRSRSGVPRVADFFANSSANVALDTLNLAIQRADEITRRADAEAFKIEDVRAANKVRYVVYCELSGTEELRAVNDSATMVLQSVGAEVRTDLEEASHELERAALSSR